jgi:hypothetical protein
VRKRESVKAGWRSAEDTHEEVRSRATDSDFDLQSEEERIENVSSRQVSRKRGHVRCWLQCW